MPLTIEDVVRHLRYDDDDFDVNHVNRLLITSTEAVKNHIKTKFDTENMVQQHAILLLCGYYDNYRNVEKNMEINGRFLPDPVLALLNPYYVPLVM